MMKGEDSRFALAARATPPPRIGESGTIRRSNRSSLTPEEDSIGEPDDVDDEIDDLLPADLWF